MVLKYAGVKVLELCVGRDGGRTHRRHATQVKIRRESN